MMTKRFEPIMNKCGEIVDYIMSSPDIPTDENIQFKIRLSIEEAVENVVQYAYNGSIGWIEVSTRLSPDGVELIIELKDAGVPFNPLNNPDPDITLSAEDREVGGLGIFLCKKMMDEVTYNYIDNCNVLTMKKILVKENRNTMKVTIDNDNNITKVKLQGRVDTTNADKFRQDMTELMQDKYMNIEMDCADMEYSSSQGLRVFLMLQKSVSARSGKLVLINMKPQVKEVFDITGFSNIINIK